MSHSQPNRPKRNLSTFRLVGAFLLSLALPGSAAAAAKNSGFDHSAFDKILRAHVKNGQVDYKAIRSSARPALQGYLKAVAAAKLDGMDRDQRLAFYINAYNALVIEAVLANWPVQSVIKVPGFFKKKSHKVAGRSLTLDQLEHKVIRPEFKEPRIHFALVCAAVSCPPLMPRAFRGATLDKDLERLTRAFINSPKGAQVKVDKVAVSKLFEWFSEDFKAAAGSVSKYLARYHKTAKKRLSGGKLALTYLPYDWSLNAR